ncbi:hypothetical protein A2U01_0114760, partial [Trifolium medium]|nr:hypothetical protein [Trifolium medium]
TCTTCLCLGAAWAVPVWELNPTLPEFRGVVLGQDVLTRNSKGNVVQE